MKFNSARYNRIEAEVLSHISMITVRLPDGSIVNMEGMAPKGSTIAFYCTDISGNKLLGFDGEIELVYVPSTTKKAEPLPSAFSQEEILQWESK